MPQLAVIKGNDIQYKCHACGWHSVPVKIGVKEDKFWQWNGSLGSPTLTPSVKHWHDGYQKDSECEGVPPYCCHYIITNGVIAFCGDCTHDKAGQSLPMIPYTDGEVKVYDASN